MDKYCYCIDDEYFIGEYDSREKAFEAGKNDLACELTPEDLLYNEEFKIEIGKCDYFEPEIEEFDTDTIIERISDNAYDYCGYSNYMTDVPKEHVKELSKMLTETFVEWMKKCNVHDRCWGVTNIVIHKVTRKDLGL